MRRHTAFAVGALAAGAMAAGTLAVGVAAASTSSGVATGARSTTCPAGGTCAGAGQGQGRMGQNGMGQGRMDRKGMGQNGMGQNGMGQNGRGQGEPGRMDSGAHLPASGSLTASQKTELQAMAEEEKLAHDVYVALAAKTGDARFTRISRAETQHLTMIRVLLTRYGVSDPTAGKADGAFTSASVQSLHDAFVARGSASLAAALQVGRDIETTDIADLTAAAKGLAAPDVTQVYTNLTAASRNHLRAFGG